jgi:6-phosphogluconolactonase
MKKVCCLLWALLPTMWLMASPTTSKAGQTQFWVYIGIHNNKPGQTGKGIYLYRLDAATGQVTEQGLAAEIDDPGWQSIPDSGKFLYTIGAKDNHKTSIVAAYRIDRSTGKLTLINQQLSKGGGTTHIDTDPAGTCAATANYGSGDLSVLPISPDGSIGEATAVIKHTGSGVNPDRQKKPYPHSCNFDPTGKWVLVPDLGVDKVYIYRFDAAGKALKDADPPTVSVTPGSGPRHMSWDPTGKFAYLISEMGGTVTVFSWDATAGRLTQLQSVSTLPPDFKGLNTSAEVHILPNGKFLYASNRGPDDLAIFSRDTTTGMIKLIGFQSVLGKGPRDFKIDPTGNYLFAAHEQSDSVAIFKINQETGGLTPTGQMLKVGSPICVTFLAVQ